MKNRILLASVCAALLAAAPVHASLEPLQSPTLVRAKDHIADEQWERAIEQLKAAVSDSRERNKDEALFWLAHSLHQLRDYKAGLDTILSLEKQFPKSPWVKPARSLRIEIAQKLQARDVLWYTIRPDGAFTAATPGAPPAGGASPAAPAGATPAAAPPRATGRSSSRRASSSGPATITITQEPSQVWFAEGWSPDSQQRMLALSSLMHTDAPKVIPILKEIALESPDPGEASRAVFLLMQSGKPEAHRSVIEVAHQGSELVQMAAVRELGRFGGPRTADELLKVYSSGAPRVKHQIVNALGERRATAALTAILQRESDRRLQETVIVRLGQAGGRQQLHQFYEKARVELKRPIIVGLFNARAEDELMAIAERERDEVIRREALTRLRLLNTAKARAYIEKQRQNR